MDTNKRLKDTLLFNILSYMSNQLLGRGNTVAAVDELYLFLTNMTAIEYIRNGMKRVRKKESSFKISRTFCCLRSRSLPNRCSAFRLIIFCSIPVIFLRLRLLIRCSLKNQSTASSSIPKEVLACIGAATRGICYRSLLLALRRHCLVRREEDKKLFAIIVEFECDYKGR